MIQRLFHVDEVSAAQIGTLGKLFYSKIGIRGEFSAGTFVDFWNQFLDRGLSSMWVGRETENGPIIGCIGFNLTMSIFDGHTIAEEAFWFVDPDHRGTVGLRLFDEAKKWAESSGARRILMGKMISMGSESVGRFYERNGFRALQTEYYLDI